MASRAAGIDTVMATRQQTASLIAAMARYHANISILVTTAQETYNVASRAGNPSASRHG